MNKVILVGRLSKDPIHKQAAHEGGTSSARFTLAVDDSYRKKGGEEDPDWIPCVCFGAKADALAKHCKKGTKVIVNGRIKTGSYTAQSGEKIYTWNVVIDEWEFAESKASTPKTQPPESNQYVPQEQFTQAATPTVNEQPQTAEQGFSNDEEVPDGFLSDLDTGGEFFFG